MSISVKDKDFRSAISVITELANYYEARAKSSKNSNEKIFFERSDAYHKIKKMLINEVVQGVVHSDD